MHMVLSSSKEQRQNRVDSGWAEMATSAQRNLLLKVVTASKDTLARIIVEENVDVAHTAHQHNLDMKTYTAYALGRGRNGLTKIMIKIRALRVDKGDWRRFRNMSHITCLLGRL